MSSLYMIPSYPLDSNFCRPFDWDLLTCSPFDLGTLRLVDLLTWGHFDL